MKQSFLLYADTYDSIRLLEPHQKGQLLDAIFAYQRGENMPVLEPVVEMAFSFLQRNFERDAAKYAERCVKAKTAARMRWDANACERINIDAKHADTVPVPVPVPEHDSKNKPPTPKTEPGVHEGEGAKGKPEDPRPTQCPPELWERYLKISRGFHRDKASQLGARAPFTEAKVIEGAKVLDNLIRVKGRPEYEVVGVLGWSTEDGFWSDNLRSIGALLKKSHSNGETKYANVLTAWTRDIERKIEIEAQRG